MISLDGEDVVYLNEARLIVLLLAWQSRWLRNWTCCGKYVNRMQVHATQRTHRLTCVRQVGHSEEPGCDDGAGDQRQELASQHDKYRNSNPLTDAKGQNGSTNRLHGRIRPTAFRGDAKCMIGDRKHPTSKPTATASAWATACKRWKPILRISGADTMLTLA